MNSEIIYLNDNREVVPEDEATNVEIIATDDDGNVTHTYGQLEKKENIIDDIMSNFEVEPEAVEQ